MKNKFRIIWSVDPFAKSPQVQKSAALILNAVASGIPTTVLPTHVLAAGLPERLMNIKANGAKLLRQRGQSVVDGILGSKRSNVEPLTILPKEFSSVRGGVFELLKFSRKAKADLIVLSTHAKTAPTRWFVGSFAETLTTLSDIPVLVAPPSWSPKRLGGKVLYATDFSSGSLKAFEKFLPLAKKLGLKVTLFNHVDYNFYESYGFAYSLLDTYEDDLAEVVKGRKAQAQAWVTKAKRAGVSSEVLIRSSRSLDVGSSIIKELGGEYLFVALASQSDSVTTFFLGGTTRDLIRRSPIPIWILHPSK